MSNTTIAVKKKLSMQQKDSILGFLLILPSVLMIVAVILYPVIYNVQLGFQKVALNPRKPNAWVGVSNYLKLFTDGEFYTVLGITILFVIITVTASTVTGLLVAMLMNRTFKGRGMARSLILLSYVTPMISLVFVWRYMFNALYGVINYITVDVLQLFTVAPAWFDNLQYSFFMVVIFDTWRVFPYAFMMLLASLQAIDTSLYEAAEVDGATAWPKFWHITFPEILPAIISVATLRVIWNFYKFDDVYLLTKQLPVIGVYLYKTAFASNDYGLAASITVVLFFIVMLLVMLMRKAVFKRNEA